eukprot:TRINITY_DN7277_c0_g1_i1.p1 TRINITY_DN7277_c0_g1~~TRINITY_DN7277_c0_g1_i1.p1  ORF type:complete len:419 (+),score=134.54 TRINITY_DN7277_c0_g1_i1:83-1339(+)
MVTFTCGACGESLKKNKVQQHYERKCPDCNVLSCIDCGKDFYGDDYASHTSCISEAQKYEGALFKGDKSSKTKGKAKQMTWLKEVRQRVAVYRVTHARMQRELDALLEYKNIPRKEKPFKNFIKSALRLKTPSQQQQFWAMFDPDEPTPTMPGDKTKDEKDNKSGGQRKAESSSDASKDTKATTKSAKRSASDRSDDSDDTGDDETKNTSAKAASPTSPANKAAVDGKSASASASASAAPAFFIDLGDGQAMPPVATHTTPKYFKAKDEEPAKKKAKKSKKAKVELPSIVKEIANSFAQLEALQPAEPVKVEKKKPSRKEKKARKQKKNKKRRLKMVTKDEETGQKKVKGIKSQRKTKAAIVLALKAGEKDAKDAAKKHKRAERKAAEKEAKAKRRQGKEEKYARHKELRKAAAAAQE